MKDCYIKARAYVDWLEFKEIVEDTYCSLECLCRTYKGHNFDKDNHMFDCNFNSICCTVIEKEGYFTLTNDIEVYDVDGNMLGSWGANELMQYIKEEE